VTAADSGFFLSSSLSLLSSALMRAEFRVIFSFVRVCSCFMARRCASRVVISSIVDLFFFSFFSSLHMRTFECVFFLVCIRASMCACIRASRDKLLRAYIRTFKRVLSFSLYIYILSRERRRSDDDDRREEQRGDFARRRRRWWHFRGIIGRRAEFDANSVAHAMRRVSRDFAQNRERYSRRGEKTRKREVE